MKQQPLPRRAIAIAIGGLVCAATLGACGSSGGAKAALVKAGSTTNPPAVTTTTRKPNPYYDSGNTVIITTTGFQPRELIARSDVPLHFVNHTATVQRVQFEHSRDASGRLIRSTAIAPGGTWSYTFTDWESATYHSIDQPALRGQVQIQPPTEP